MTLSRAFSLALLLIGSCFAAAETAAGGSKTDDQVDPSEDLAALYPQAGHIGLAIAIVPDPHVPRYRRLFDLDVHAVTLGMLNDGYVLDRYAFPWNDTVTEAEDKSEAKDKTDRGAFGLMIFRCDSWRGRQCVDPAKRAGPPQAAASTTLIRAIYFVTDTATWGVATPPLVCATRRIRAQLPGNLPAKQSAQTPAGHDFCPKRDEPDTTSTPEAPKVPSAARVGLLQFPGECSLREPHRTLVLLGPTFSGAMDSVGQHLGEVLGPGVTDVCLVSSFTTVSSNQLVTGLYKNLHYARLALDDGVKLLGIANLAQSFGYFEPDAPADKDGDPAEKEVAFLAEASTFGYGICNPAESMEPKARERVRQFCADARTLYFPAAIADIRYGLDQQREQQKNEVQAAVKAALPSEHLTLEVGAENGSEFPENRQSKLTAASQQLALDHVLDQLEQSAPKIVVVVATDVRDRLFLFDQLRHRLPSALLVDLETDILLAHPDFLHASRGAITIASSNLFVRGGKLFGCEEGRRVTGIQVPLASWALDGQGMLADAVARLDDASPPMTKRPCIDNPDRIGKRMPVMHVVTLKGLRRISRPFERAPPKDGPDPIRQRQVNLNVAQWVAFICCIVIVAPWLWIRPMQRSEKCGQYFSARNITFIAGAASLVSWLFAMFVAYGGREDPESGYALAYWSVTILAMALGGLYLCVARVHEAGVRAGKLPRKYRLAIGAVGLVACALAAVPVVIRQLIPTSTALDEDRLTRLALDIGLGLAYHVVTPVGVVTVLFTMISLATGACIMTRNNGLLAIRTPCSDCDAGARTPRFPTSAIVAMVLLVALIGVPSLVTDLGGPRLSVFGPAPSLIATIVIFVTTLSASVLTMVAIHSSRRIRTIAAHIGRCVTPKEARGKNGEIEYPGLWPANDWQPNLFAATPVVARVSSEIIRELNSGSSRGGKGGKSWKTLISEFLGKCDGGGNTNDGPHRRAVFALLASEISLYRWFVGGAVLCALSSVCAAYLFPIEADPLLMWNLGVLIVHALLAGYVATAFERDGVLSNILSNRPKKAEFSASLFTYAALPFFALGFAIAVSQVPGVVDWGGGVLALLGAIGVKL